MGHHWYKDWFADEHYLALYKHRNSEEASMALDLIERTIPIAMNAAILDLACGAGRHSINLAKRGYSNITGVDLSEALIAEARLSAKHEGVKVNFVVEDMRCFDGSYDLIMNLFTSFGYFATDFENEEVTRRVGQNLHNGGYFVLDFLNTEKLCLDVIPHDVKVLASGERVEQFREIANERINKRIIIHSDGGSKEFNESVRLYRLSDFQRMFANSGLNITEKFGNYDGSPYKTGSSPRLILVAKKDE